LSCNAGICVLHDFDGTLCTVDGTDGGGFCASQGHCEPCFLTNRFCGPLPGGTDFICCSGVCGENSNCEGPQTLSSLAESESNCVPIVCADGDCGAIDDGCGGTIDCGECPATTTTAAPCVPRDFCTEGECGPVDDGCGGTVDCGDCAITTPAPAPTTTAVPCIPTTCEQVGCGNYANDCINGDVYCGDCCTPSTCEQAGCGNFANDCVTGEIYCGDCTTVPPPVTCHAEGERCVNDEQCCEGLCRGRECRDWGTKLCQAACTT
jgi:hypothetical protein